MSSYLKKTPAEKLLYESHEGVYYLRKRDGVSGTDTDICLHTKKKTVAVEARDAYLAARVASKLGIAYNPNRKRVKVSAVLELYEAAQYPDDDGNPREEGNHLRSEKAAIVHLREHFRGYTEEITQGKLDACKNWRCHQVKKTKTSSGKRTVDLELNTLCNACKWAVRKDLISQNPLEKRKRYHKSSPARHAKNVQPQSVDEFHEICLRIPAARCWAGRRCGKAAPACARTKFCFSVWTLAQVSRDMSPTAACASGQASRKKLIRPPTSNCGPI